MKYVLFLLTLLVGTFSCSKNKLPGYSGSGGSGSGYSSSSSYPPPTMITVRFYSSDSLMAKNCLFFIDSGGDLPIRYSAKEPLCTDSLFQAVSLAAEVEYVIRVMNYDIPKEIDTFHFKRDKFSSLCVSWNLRRKN